jgi:hypothetical protein
MVASLMDCEAKGESAFIGMEFAGKKLNPVWKI